MVMDLKTFEADIDPTILQRGKYYFTEGAVQNLEEFKKGEWFAEVVGTELYEVEIHLSQNRINYYECSCPYDHGPVCKHVAAVLYALQENKASSKKESNTAKKPGRTAKEPSKKNMIQEILNKVSHQDLKKFLLEYALRKNEFGSMLLARFPNHTGVEGKEKYALIISSAIKSGTGRNGFIEYHQVKQIIKPIKELLQQAQDYFGKKYYAEAVAVCQAIIEELTRATEQMADESGQASNAIETAFDLLEQIAEESIPVPLRDSLFAYALKMAPEPLFYNIGLDVYWFELLDKLAKDAEKESQVIALVEDLLQKHAQKDKSLSKKNKSFRIIMSSFFADDLEEKKLAIYLVRFLTNRGKADEVAAVIQKYKHISEFRELLLEQALKQQQYDVARQMIKEASSQDKASKFGGYNNHWDQWLLRIAEAEQNIPEVQKLACSLFLQSFKPEYYRKLKQTYSPEAWPAQYENLVATLLKEEKNVWHNPWQIVPVLIEEKDWPKLFAYVSRRPELNLLLEVSKYLKKDYGPQLLPLFENTLYTYADSNTSKSGYKNVADVLQHITTLEGGKPLVRRLLADFRELFKKRRNMMEALNKVKVD
jgi:uncharacterized Zn finger protein